MDLILVELRDVTERKQGRADCGARLQIILNAVPEAVIATDTKVIITGYSPPSVLIMGNTQAEMMGRNVSMLMREPHRRNHDAYISAYLETSEAKSIGTGRELGPSTSLAVRCRCI